jgi:hypothetical protein
VCEEAIVGRRIRKECVKKLLFGKRELEGIALHIAKNKIKMLEGSRRKGRKRKKEKVQYYYKKGKKEKRGRRRGKRSSFVVGVDRDATR